MQLKSGSKLFIDLSLRNEIASVKHRICTVEEIKTYSPSKKIVAVGDVTTAALKENGVDLLLEIVDLKTKRVSNGTFRHEPGSLIIENPAGYITYELMEGIRIALSSRKKTRIEIIGEEDLSVIPIIFYADQNTLVTYGVPDTGIACIEIDNKIKEYTKNLMERMKVVW
jgi:uncharacterized protein (UPF0218 family)